MRDVEREESDRDAEVERALHLWVVLSRAHAAVAAQARADVARHGLTLGEFGVLEVLHHKGPLLLGEVQQKVLVSSGGITWLANRLEERGLVERRRSTDDRRASFVALTPAGARLMRRIFPAHARRIARALSGLDAEAQRQATDLLRTLGRHAAAHDEGEPPEG
ncbi:MAG TPA: MarR family transcriptional regulator [Gemmatimonadaceae bacterium]|nr:MarR family transcriptional regulator [Gemmatimonadaceae bacterium]